MISVIAGKRNAQFRFRRYYTYDTAILPALPLKIRHERWHLTLTSSVSYLKLEKRPDPHMALLWKKKTYLIILPGRIPPRISVTNQAPSLDPRWVTSTSPKAHKCTSSHWVWSMFSMPALDSWRKDASNHKHCTSALGRWHNAVHDMNHSKPTPAWQTKWTWDRRSSFAAIEWDYLNLRLTLPMNSTLARCNKTWHASSDKLIKNVNLQI